MGKFEIAGSIICFVFAVNAFAVNTEIWETKEFTKCKLSNVMLDENGSALVAPGIKQIWKNPEIYIWSMIKLEDGIYVGTGGKGKVYKLSANADTCIAKDLALSDTTQAGVFSLVEHKGFIYAGTSTDGIIYKIDKSGKSKILAKTKEKYVWEMVFDNEGILYAATGVTGDILKINEDGKFDTLYTTPDKNVTALNYYNGFLYAGTGENGYLFKIDKSGKGICIFDAPEKEIKVVVPVDTLLLVAATEDTSGSVYCIHPDNKVEKIWSINTTIRGLEWIAKDKNMLVAAGKRLYRVKMNGTSSAQTNMINEFPGDISCLFADGRDVFVCTSEVGKLYRMSGGAASEDSIVSDTYDTDGISEWGRLDFEGTGEIKFFTHSGNIGTPDKTWSSWNVVGEEGKINSPDARFVQWKAELENDKTRLTNVKITFLPQNKKPEIISLKVASKPEKEIIPIMQKENTRKIVWSAKDPDGDSLIFDLYFKLTGEQKWTLIKAGLRDTFYGMDPLVFPDGKYEFKLVCSDSLSNPKNKTLKTEKVSLPELIDNTAPEIKDMKVEGHKLVFSAVDELSYIKSCEYAVDGGDWNMLFPVSGIFDSKKENFSVDIGNAHKVVVRVRDSFDNTRLKSEIIK